MFKHLLSPFRIGQLELPNRLVVAPMGVEIAEADGQVREPVVAYYAERARGGAGLIITENTSVGYPRGANSAHELGVSDDLFLPGLRALTDAVHAEGGRIAIQLAHHGKVARLDTQHGRELIMPSVPEKTFTPTGPLDLTQPEMIAMAKAGGGRPTIRAATPEDIEEVIAMFVSAVERAQRAGFDGAELHAAHGYIFSEFLSPAWNKRTDCYGGGHENRARLLCETLQACRAAVGDDFPLWCRIDAQEFGEPGGILLEQAVETARLAEKAGADAIHVSAYAPPLGAGFTLGPIVHQAGGYVGFAEKIKAAVSVPVIAVGRISPQRGEAVIRDGQADLIAMGRPMLADPALPAKLGEGKPESVRPCVYCYTCVAQPFFDRRVRCAVNPVTAHESELGDRVRQPAPERKRVVVIGGGPAGLEAARVAALRGHDVSLMEEGEQLGGSLRLAALMYEPNERLLEWLTGEVETQGVRIKLGVAPEIRDIRAENPDVVIVATGADRRAPSLSGCEKPHVFDGDSLRSLLGGEGASSSRTSLGFSSRFLLGAGRRLGLFRNPSLLRRLSRYYMPMGQRVVVVGGGLVGVELAEFLAARGREVTVIEKGPVAATEMAHPRRWRVLHDLREMGVKLLTDACVESIEEDHVVYSQVQEEEGAQMSRVEADSVILTLGLTPNPDLAERLRADGIEPICIGDCNGVGYIEGAIAQGFQAGLEIGEPERA
ncbi:MAG: FAD-dependent oxidoreductase [Myxococcota bacterium]|nr:FAD-dependent oxidoreductase [Myxococcota bacterium]